ncbi:MAG TPA: CCC motif membrane protein [Robiginitalea sp.]|nr:CCC motif membrane protein [Robiginitalea sp.]
MSHEPLPGASTAMTMGIISVVGALVCCGPFAAIFSIIGLSNARKAEILYRQAPDRYSGFENIKTARVLNYIGLGLSLVMLVLAILYFGFIVALITAETF